MCVYCTTVLLCMGGGPQVLNTLLPQKQARAVRLGCAHVAPCGTHVALLLTCSPDPSCRATQQLRYSDS